MSTKPAIVIGLALVLASAVLALVPRFAPPSISGNTDLGEVKSELGQVKSELTQVKATMENTAAEQQKATEATNAWEKKWAEVIIHEFVSAVTSSNGSGAFALLSKDFQDRLPGDCQQAKSAVYLEKRKYTGGIRINTLIKEFQLSPSRDSVFAFVDYKVVGTVEKVIHISEGNFSLYAVKERRSGSWKVDFIKGLGRPRP